MAKAAEVTVLTGLVFFLVALSGQYSHCTGASLLQAGFYKGKCGSADVEAVISGVVQTLFNKDPTVPAALLRLHFHDCFINGCDASILLDGEQSEKTAGDNRNVRGFDVIDAIKEAVEAACPGVVSCADIIALATRDAVVLGGGPRYAAETGRRDGHVSLARLVRMPQPFISVAESIKEFADKGINVVDMTYLIGAHTVGVTHCSFFQDRLYNFNGTGKPDPTMSPDLVSSLRIKCPQMANFDNAADLDQNKTSSLIVDNSFYKQILLKRGVLQIDQELALDPNTNFIVKVAAEDVLDFTTKFSSAMINMGAIQVLTGEQGEIRTSCRAVNAKN